MPRLQLTDEDATEVLLKGQAAQLAGAPLSDNPWHGDPSNFRRAFWTRGYMMAEALALGPVDPQTGAPILQPMTKQLEGGPR